MAGRKNSSAHKPTYWKPLQFDWNNGQGLLDARTARCITQEDLSSLAHVSVPTIYLYEQFPESPRHKNPTYETLKKLESALNVTFVNVGLGSTGI
jgi:transcriptional regulator with XRE-family HTH domain